MAATILLKRATGKDHFTSFQEGTDDAVLSSLLRTASGGATAWNDAFTTTVTIGGSVQTTGSLFDGVAMTTLTIGAGMGAGDTIDLGGSGSLVTIPGDLLVQGTTTSVDSEVVNIADNHLYLNAGYTTAAAQTGGLVVNYLPTATTDTSTTGGFASATTVNTTGAATFSAGDFVQVSGAANPANNGIYEVLTHAANVMTIDSTPVESFAQTAFTTDTGDTTAALTNVTVSVIRSGTDGVWETGSGTSQPISYSDLASAGGNSLQQAYDVGNTIGMTDASGDFSVTVTSGTPGIILEAADVSRFQVTSATLTLSTVTSGALAISGAGVVDVDAAAALALNSSGGAINIGNDAVAQPVNIGTGAAARTVTIGNGTGASSTVIEAGTGPINVGVNAIARTITIGNGTGASSTVIESGTGPISIGANAVAHTVNIGNATGATLVNIDSGTGGVTIDAPATADIALTVPADAGSDILLSAHGQQHPFNSVADPTLTTTAQNLVGAINEVAAGAVADRLTESYTTTGRAIGEPVLHDGDNSANTVTDASTLAGSEAFAGVVLTVGTPGTVVTQGSIPVQFVGGLTAGTYPVAGDPIYLSETAGRVTTVAPSGNPQSGVVIYQIGTMKDTSTLTATTTVDGDLGEILLAPKKLFEF